MDAPDKYLYWPCPKCGFSPDNFKESHRIRYTPPNYAENASFPTKNECITSMCSLCGYTQEMPCADAK